MTRTWNRLERVGSVQDANFAIVRSGFMLWKVQAVSLGVTIDLGSWHMTRWGAIRAMMQFASAHSAAPEYFKLAL